MNESQKQTKHPQKQDKHTVWVLLLQTLRVAKATFKGGKPPHLSWFLSCSFEWGSAAMTLSIFIQMCFYELFFWKTGQSGLEGERNEGVYGWCLLCSSISYIIHTCLFSVFALSNPHCAEQHWWWTWKTDGFLVSHSAENTHQLFQLWVPIFVIFSFHSHFFFNISWYMYLPQCCFNYFISIFHEFG